MVSQEIAGADVLGAEVAHDPVGDGALARAGGADDERAHALRRGQRPAAGAERARQEDGGRRLGRRGDQQGTQPGNHDAT